MDVVGARADRSSPHPDSDDIASADETGDDTGEGGEGGPVLDLTPRTGPGTGAGPVIHGRRPHGSTRRWPWVVVLLAVIVGIGFVVSHAINDATLFFYNADEAVAKQPDLGTAKRFRLQGSVVAGSTTRTDRGVSFLVGFNGVDVAVHHVGDPPDLFRDGIPVVLEGHWESTGPGAAFASDRILVKHSENYEAQNPDRIKQAEQGGAQPSPPPSTPPTSTSPAPVAGSAAP
jgi:cytochrome c-type biogenesis protein CcmE